MVQSWFGTPELLKDWLQLSISFFQISTLDLWQSLNLEPIRKNTQCSQDVHKKYKHIDTF